MQEGLPACQPCAPRMNLEFAWVIVLLTRWQTGKPPDRGCVGNPSFVPHPSSSFTERKGGRVSPEAWFHKKPSGCINGAACKRCHLCPEGEPKLRKKQCLDPWGSVGASGQPAKRREASNKPKTQESCAATATAGGGCQPRGGTGWQLQPKAP